MNHKAIPTNNTEWAVQQLAANLTKAEINALQASLQLMDKVLYKSWAKDLTLTELIEAARQAVK